MNDTTATSNTDSITTTQGREELIAKAKDTVTGATQSAVETVKANPKTAAAIAVGAVAAVAGVAYGATKLSEKSDGKTTKKTTSTKK